MNTKQLLGFFGSLVIIIGVFAPVVSIPIIGSTNFYQNDKVEGILILILAAASVVLALRKIYKGLWFTGIGSFILSLISFIRLQMKLSDIKSKMGSELSGNPLKGLVDLAAQSVQLQWGWALLFAGAALIIAGAAIKEEL
jgi:hypothetical protein